METIQPTRFRGPHSGVLATIFMILFIAGLSFALSFTGGPHFPNPADPAAAISTYFQQQPHDVLMCAFFQFMSAIPLGLLVVTVYTRLRYLGVRATGPAIALFGGLMTTINMSISALLMWVMAYPGIAQDGSVIRTLYYFGFAIGGVGYSVPFGLLVAGIAVPAGIMRLLPKWVVWFGLLLAVIGEVSAFSMVVPRLVLLIPLTRFPGFIWLMIAGWKLAGRTARP